MTKFWVIMYNNKLVLSWGTLKFLRRRIVCPKFSLGPINGPAIFTSIDEAKGAAMSITEKYGGPCYILESVAVSESNQSGASK